jgi:hypothetical protein
MRISQLAVASFVVLAGAICSEGQAQDKERKFTDKDYEQALQLFRNGGWWTTRIAPEKDPGKEREWTLLVLTSKAKLKDGINGVNVGSVEYTGGKDITLEMATTAADLFDRAPADTRQEFLKRFAAAIEKGEVAAALVKVQRARKVDLPAFDGPLLTQKEFTELTGKLKFK